MEDDDIRFNPVGKGYCLVLMFPTANDAIEFESKLKEPKLHISLKENNATFIFESDIAQSVTIPVKINRVKAAAIHSKTVTHYSTGYRNMNPLTDSRCVPISVEYRLQ
jgi:hypothetical protein